MGCLISRRVCIAEQSMVLRRVVFAQMSIQLPSSRINGFSEVPEVINDIIYWLELYLPGQEFSGTTGSHMEPQLPFLITEP